MNIKNINNGSFYENMVTACKMKFGESPYINEFTSSPCADRYANQLLRQFRGNISTNIPYGGLRIFLRALLAQELGNYFLTGIKTPNLLEKVEKMDKFFWSKYYPGSHETKLLT